MFHIFRSCWFLVLSRAISSAYISGFVGPDCSDFACFFVVDSVAIVLSVLSISSVELSFSIDIALFPVDVSSWIALSQWGNLLRCVRAFCMWSRVLVCEVAECFSIQVDEIIVYRFAWISHNSHLCSRSMLVHNDCSFVWYTRKLFYIVWDLFTHSEDDDSHSRVQSTDAWKHGGCSMWAK